MARNTGAKQVMTGLLALRGGFESKTLAGAFAMDKMDSQWLRVDPGGAARAVTLPTDGADGDFYVIANVGTGAENLTVDGSLVVITPTDLAIVYHTGSAWALFALVAGVVS